MKTHSSKKLRVAFIATSGLWYGGTEKCTQKQAIALQEAGHIVDYYYNESTLYSNGNIHPGLDKSTKDFVSSCGVNTILFTCESIDAYDPQKAWNRTNLFELFDPLAYDVVIGNHKGEPMWPYSCIKGPKVIEVVHGTDFATGASTYASGYVLITHYQVPLWQRSGGVMQKTSVIPQMVYVESPSFKRDRSRWNIPVDKFVFGMHQGARHGLHSHIVLDAYSKIASEKNFFVILGGDPEYGQQASRLGIKNFSQLSAVSNPKEISSFLSCLDVYAHGRLDGEVSSSAIIEAMAMSLPIMSHPSSFNNGHLEQLDNVGFVATSVDEYARTMFVLEHEQSLRNDLSFRAKKKYDNVYCVGICKKSFVEFVEKLVEIV